MFLDHYNLLEQPFGVTPDPRYLFLSPTHREALASLLYGVKSGCGFMAMIARPGMGKTSLLFQLLRQVESSARTVFLFQTPATPRDFLRSLLGDLGMPVDGDDLVRMHSSLDEVVTAEWRNGRRIVLVIDEAQNLDPAVLEVVRMLSNFETPSQKLMQIILAGQPQLAGRLLCPELVQLRQRLSMVARIKPFSVNETSSYIDHRLHVAGYDFSRPLFTPRAIVMIASSSQGIARNINNVCFNALSLGCASKQRSIDEGMVREVLQDLDLHSLEEDGSQSAPEIANQPEKEVIRSVASLKLPRKKSMFRAWLPKFTGFAMVGLALSLLSATNWRAASFAKLRGSLSAPAVSISNRAIPQIPAEPFRQSTAATASRRYTPNRTAQQRPPVETRNHEQEF